MLPLALAGGSTAIIRDISSTGLFFEMDGEHRPAGLVDFELHLVQARLKVVATGEIVRVRHSPGRTGVAVRLIEPRLEAVE